MGMGPAPTWLHQVSPLLHMTTLTAVLVNRVCACSQPERCLYVALESENATVVLIADSQSRRDDWIQALRQLCAFRIYDVKYAYP